jgi:hypothetical protein
MRLIDVLGALDADALESLAQRFKLPVDVRKRLDLAEQVARGLSAIPRKLRVEQGDDALHEAVRLLLAAPQGLPVRSLPRGTEAHAGHGLIFRDPAHPQRLVIPAAFRMLFAATPSDNPRAARVLLGSVPDDPRRELCVHHLKRLPPLPWPMLLETPLLRLEDPAWVRAELKALSETERQFLAAVDALGGEVNAEEVLELSREPMRLSVASGVQVPRRSPVFALARRGLMLTRHDGWVVPDEVERVIGRERRARAYSERQRLLMSRHLHDLTPLRGQIAAPAGPATIAAIAKLACEGQLPSRGRAVSRLAVRRAAQELHLDPERAELLTCLARADGLIFASTTIRSVGPRLIDVYMRGGAWDEAAREPDLFRPGHPATTRATALIREAVLDALLLLPPREFALIADIEAVACTDRRALSAQRALSVAGRAGQVVHDQVLDVVRALLARSFRWLGMVDEGVTDEGAVVRLSALARASCDPAPAAAPPPEDRPGWDVETRDARTLSLGPGADVAGLVEAARAADVFFDGERIGLRFEAERLRRAAECDPELLGLRAALGALVPALPDELARALDGATAELPICDFVRAAGFVAIDDKALCAAIYGSADNAHLWAGPPLSDGLLVTPGISQREVTQALARHGVRFRGPPGE